MLVFESLTAICWPFKAKRNAGALSYLIYSTADTSWEAVQHPALTESDSRGSASMHTLNCSMGCPVTHGNHCYGRNSRREDAFRSKQIEKE